VCGIAGFWSEPASEASLRAIADHMAGMVQHRGPDGGGVWIDGLNGLALGFRRLAIVDLSAEGCQPMRSASGRYVVVFNGEIYNFQELRRELEGKGQRFRGHSDTEVLLEAVEQWGLEGALERSAGMYALALWDTHARELTLVRDRLGIKPLYYGWTHSGALVFGSELKALRGHPEFTAEVNSGSIAAMLRYGYIAAPECVYRGIRHLPPGHLLVARSPKEGTAALATYWNARRAAEVGQAAPFQGTEQEAVVELEGVLRRAVGSHMVADVPLGAFLSGGTDSSTVVALMQAQSARPIRTFSVGFREREYNEASYARAVASHLGTKHTELYVTSAEAQAVIPNLAEMYDEPFGDASAIPTHLVSKLARRHVTVALSGDGGDELFGGYNRYLVAYPWWSRVRRLPRTLVQTAVGLMRAGALLGAEQLLTPLARFVGKGRHVATAGSNLHLLADLLSERTPQGMYSRVVSRWVEPELTMSEDTGREASVVKPEDWPALGHPVHDMMLMDLLTYLPGDVLTKVDRASMAVGLEARVPLLDHRVVECAWRMPLALKVRDSRGKWLLREVLHKHVPREMVERPKMGFAVPIGDWLRGPLRDWAEAQLGEQRLRREGYLRVEPIRRVWAAHLAGERNAQDQLWNVLMFQAWVERWMRSPTPPGAAVLEVGMP
jgi:asparagine synthase (glutamine-hydrolysing)